MGKTAKAAAAALAAIALQGCLGTGEDEQITREQYNKAVADMRGQYTGSAVAELAYREYSYSTTPDTLHGLVWTSDSAITVKNFPVAALAKAVVMRDSAVIKALQGYKGTAEVPAQMAIYEVGEVHRYLLMPRAIKVTLDYDGESHEVAFPFYFDVGKSLGVWANSVQAFRITVASMYADGQPTAWLTPISFDFTSTRVEKRP